MAATFNFSSWFRHFFSVFHLQKLSPALGMELILPDYPHFRLKFDYFRATRPHPTFYSQIHIQLYLHPSFSEFMANFIKISRYLKEISDFLGYRIRLFVLFKLFNLIRIWLLTIRRYPYLTFWQSFHHYPVLSATRVGTTFVIYWELPISENTEAKIILGYLLQYLFILFYITFQGTNLTF